MPIYASTLHVVVHHAARDGQEKKNDREGIQVGGNHLDKGQVIKNSFIQAIIERAESILPSESQVGGNRVVAY